MLKGIMSILQWVSTGVIVGFLFYWLYSGHLKLYPLVAAGVVFLITIFWVPEFYGIIERIKKQRK